MKIPILRLERILLVSIQEDLTDNDAMDFQSDLVERVAEIEALGVAIDITALDVVDSYMARVINDTASMVRLLGAEAVICGVQPFVALTLIEMGRDLLGADCAFNLGQGLEILKTRIATRGDTRFAGDEDV
ncbi:STAS domain-containing protein [Thiocystis violascens]|uniref:Anti-anti-sigma regulatory factor (Antagonist of anti-sigma factor) n=1 Tax=Thiocystis violascens (strain ATCC 17096 / DSM 198 / 6111) TaxID=765911 RepID=I3Y5Y3_THIV6|nr:STAS domain-containing protein [Thiocystis violascens]AFL72401.1 anti-anti-sigma regulatory factor (antagonist of anti-sigma factor) [Thiocystis violascens DSM 198]